MANYIGLGQIAQQSEFQNRVRYALFLAAGNAFTEDGGTPNHATRAAFASKVFNGQYDLLSAAMGVLTNPTIASGADAAISGNGISDGDLQFSMNSIYETLAGTA